MPNSYCIGSKKQNCARRPSPSIHYTKTLLVANKIDLPGAPERIEVVRELFGPRFPVHVISAENGTGPGHHPGFGAVAWNHACGDAPNSSGE